MKTVESILLEAKQQGIKLSVESGKLNCSAPKGALSEQFKNSLREHKEKIIFMLSQLQNNSVANQLPKIDVVNREQGVSLSSAQQQLWYLYKISPTLPVYNESLVIHVHVPIVLEILEQALVYLVNRHESLRTNFREIGDSVVQIIQQPIKHFSIIYYDVSNCSASDQAQQINQLGKQDLIKPFNLLTDNHLFRVILFRCNDNYFQIHLVMHHLMIDGSSAFNIFFPELQTIYQALLQQQTPVLPKITIQYADYAAWQQDCLSQSLMNESIAYWRKKLANFTELSLPYDKVDTTSAPNFEGSQLLCVIDVETIKQLKKIAQHYRTTLFTVVATTVGVLLRRYTQQEDIIWGTIFSLRDRPELNSVIGNFINLVPLRTHLSGEQTFESCIEQVKSIIIEAQKHAYLPFDRLIADLLTERDAVSIPLINVVLIFQPPLNMTSDWQLSRTDLHTDTSKFDLLIEFQERANGAVVKLEFNHRFKTQTAQQLLEHFKILIEQADKSLLTAIDAIDILTPSEKEQLKCWNATTTAHPTSKPLLTGLMQQICQNANKIALIYEDKSLTYTELEEQSNQIANYLQQCDVVPGALIGLCMHRSIHQILALIGIIKVGAAYVPLDPNYPSERLAVMIEEAQLSWVITDKGAQIDFIQPKINLLNINHLWNNITQQSVNHCPASMAEDSRVYVIFTSGSTGKPKGVVHTYRSLNNLIAWQLAQNKAIESFKTLQFASINFDVSFQEIFSTLCNGGTLVLINEENRKNIKKLLETLNQEQIQRFYLPYVVLRELAEHLYEFPEACPYHLREIITAGEQLQITPAITTLFQKLPKCRLYNHYGPSETHVVTAFQLLEDVAKWDLLPSIGYPIDNVQIYILNTQLHPVPIGTTGELYIGGKAVAEGYLNNTYLTQERFISNPFTEHPDILYKTGDLVRFQRNGLIDYVGRSDNQVKIRGFRIEPAEIETILGLHPNIKQAVILAKTATNQDKFLVAYILLQHGLDVSTNLAEQLRIYLKQKLPHYMVPKQFIILEQFPITPSGKVNKLALAALITDNIEIRHIYLGPRDSIEMELARIWQEILGINQIGIQENFFHLGGHSLLAMKLMVRIERAFQQDLSIAALMQHPTIESLAQLLRSNQAHDVWPVLIPIQSQGVSAPLYCIPGSGGNVVYFQEFVTLLNQDRPIYGLQARGLDGVTDPHVSIEAMAADYIQQIKSVQPQGPYYLLGHSVGGAVAFAISILLQSQGDKVAFLGLLDTPAPRTNLVNTEHWDHAQWLVAIANLLENLSGQSILINLTDLKTLPENEQLILFKQTLEQAGMLPLNSKLQRVQGMVNVMRAGDTAYMNFQPAQINDQRITLLRAKELYKQDQLGLLYETLDDSTWGWKNYTNCPVDVHWVDGNHLSILKQPQVQNLAQVVSSLLNNF